MPYFKAFIRVVKSIQIDYSTFGSFSVIEERFIESESKDDVKKYMLDKYPQFFQNSKVYTRETKDEAQFFYLLVYPLYDFEIQLIEKGSWICYQCGHVHESRYHSRPRINERLLGLDYMFCKSEDDICLNGFLDSKYEGVELRDDPYYIKSDSPNYIYKITEKATGKSYIGKTKNAPFFRWWNHLTKSSSPFGQYLSKTKLSEWTFEVLEELPANMLDSQIFEIESKYILQFDSLKNGFNSLISNKSVLPQQNSNQETLIFESDETIEQKT